MDYVTDKIGEGTWTLYLYECPNCHCTRSLDKTKLATMAAMAVDKLSVEEFHDRVNTIAAQHLGAIQVLGYFLGAIVGVGLLVVG